MRKELKARYGRRGRFHATFKKFGAQRHGEFPPTPTALFLDVRDEDGEVVADHLWFTVGDQLGRLELKPGDEVFFFARVTKYRKRNPDAIDQDDPLWVEDYRLSHPSKISKLGAQPARPLPLFGDGDSVAGQQ
jgi:hypothetical protein